MSASVYRERIGGVLGKIWETQMENIEKASAVMAGTIAKGGLVHMFGSGHSVLPVQDMFPRYGAFPGFRPLMDMRLMWTTVIGSGGAKGLLWLEQREGYAQVLFENEPIREGDVMLVFSHGGLNAAGIEVLMEAKKRGLTTVGVTFDGQLPEARGDAFLEEKAGGCGGHRDRQLHASRRCVGGD